MSLAPGKKTYAVLGLVLLFVILGFLGIIEKSTVNAVLQILLPLGGITFAAKINRAVKNGKVASTETNQ